jgi:LysR family transcriptional regulator, regulator for genes of the gallate degradation pathway
MKPNFRRLEALLTVADNGSITAAARQLHVTAPAVTKAIRELEKACETPLFVRTRKGVSPTPAGVAMIQRARSALSELERGEQEIRELRGIRQGRIVIGALPFARSVLLPRALERLATGRPELDVAVIDGEFDLIVDSLREGKLDFIVGALRASKPLADLIQEHLFDDPIVIIARKGHPLERRRQIALSKLTHYPWIVPPASSPVRQLLDASFADVGVEAPAHPAVSSSLEVLRGMILEGDRIGVISRNRIAHELHSGLVVELSVPLTHDTRPVGIIRRPTRGTPAAEELLRHIRDVAADLSRNQRRR